ncbi:heterokaryon incompatibility protein-domain-containing protein [Xylogone sp. PMI_703]|nr:heterokaryon incompatibility protein-domain-containing protein [Xylogone sp. PMI_703]
MRDLDLEWPLSVQYSIQEDGEDEDFFFETNMQEDIIASGSTGAFPDFSRSSQTESLITYVNIPDANSIRLLVLHKGGTSDPLHGRLKVMELNSSPLFEALSYTRADETGNSTRCERIFLGEFWDVLHITSSCEKALRWLRYAREDRVLWVDSIYINQDNDNERSHQVGMMHDIFRNAVRVLAYLGDEFEGGETAIATIESIGNKEAVEQSFTPSQYHSLRRLFSVPYFKRSWIIQEILLTNLVDLYCGQSTVISNKKDTRIQQLC